MATVVPLHSGGGGADSGNATVPADYTAAVDRYLAAAGISTGSARIYRIALHTWAWLLAGDQPPVGRARRGATPPAVSLHALEEPTMPARLASAFAARAASTDADTINRELSVLRAAIGWWHRQGWLRVDPTGELQRRPAPPDRTRALSREQVAALFALDVGLREKTYWRMLYETAARAGELLRLDVGDLDFANKRARVTSKGGSRDWVHWQSGTATLLPRLLKGRTRGPIFCTDRAAPTRTPTLDVCPVTGRARLSYRRAAELFTTATRPLSEGDGCCISFATARSPTRPRTTPTPRCCWPAPATPRSGRWNATPVLARHHELPYRRRSSIPTRRSRRVPGAPG